jgi:hypothetical protein
MFKLDIKYILVIGIIIFLMLYLNKETFKGMTSKRTTPTTTNTNNNNNNNKKKGGCFSGTELVTLESGEKKMLSRVNIGDRILTSNKNGELYYSDVVFIPHSYNNTPTNFIEITTESGIKLKMTYDHLIPIKKENEDFELTYASNININDYVNTINGIQKISNINIIEDNGIYTVVTNNEFLVVNDIIASPFATSHIVPHLFYNVVRMMYNTSNKSYNKILN